MSNASVFASVKVILAKMNRSNSPVFFLRATIVGLAILLIGCGQKGALFLAPQEAEIRFYSIDSNNQQRELLLVPGASQPGCHNLPLTRSVYRVAQVGFESCQVFAEKDCAPGTDYSLRWAAASEDPDKLEPTTNITPGAKWLFSSLTKTKVKSWSCQNSRD